MELIIEPLIGVGPIKLNMSKEQVHAVLGPPDFSHGNREGFLSGLMVNFSQEGKVEFIELAKSERYVALLNGIDAHSWPASEVVELLAKQAAFDSADPELGYSYIFKDMQLSLWRSVMPESISDSEGRYFEAVGIGVRDYFA
jgi:hypothetical protein